MLTMVIAAMLAGGLSGGLSGAVQVEGQWQEFGRGADGVAVAVNLDSIERGTEGAEAMVRWRYPRADRSGASEADTLSRFDCGGRTVTRLRLVEHNAGGAVVDRVDEGERMTPVRAAAGTPIGRVLDLVCSIAGA